MHMHTHTHIYTHTHMCTYTYTHSHIHTLTTAKSPGELTIPDMTNMAHRFFKACLVGGDSSEESSVS